MQLRDNTIEGVSIRIRVAASNNKSDTNWFYSGSVELTGNRLRFRPYTEGVYVPFGVFVGNVNTLWIIDIGRGGVWYPQTVRVWAFGASIWWSTPP